MDVNTQANVVHSAVTCKFNQGDGALGQHLSECVRLEGGVGGTRGNI